MENVKMIIEVEKEEKFFVIETDEYSRLVKLFVENGLEYDGDEEVETEIINIYKMVDKDDRLIGGIVLASREGRYIIDGITVIEEYRKLHLGKQLLDIAIDQIKEYNGHSLYLVARAPGFFRRNGFVEVDQENAPNFFECKTCPQYRKTCSPEIMKLEF